MEIIAAYSHNVNIAKMCWLGNKDISQQLTQRLDYYIYFNCETNFEEVSESHIVLGYLIG